MADITLTLLDNFNYTASPINSGHSEWSLDMGSTHFGNVVADGSSGAKSGSDGDTTECSAYRNDVSFADGVGAFATVISIPAAAAGTMGVLLCLQGTGNSNGYVAQVRIRNHAPTPDTFRIRRFDAGVESSDLATGDQTIAVGDIIGAIKTGSTITFYYKASGASIYTAICSVSDSTYSGGGKIGIYFNGGSPSPAFDNLSSGVLSVADTPQWPSRALARW